MNHKEFRIITRVKNNLLIEEREALGLTQAKMAKFLGIPFQTYCSMECLKFKALLDDGNWAKGAKQVAIILNKPPGYFWPECVRMIEKNKVTRKISAKDMLALVSTDSPLLATEKKETARDISRVLMTLTPREEDIVRSYHGISPTKQESIPDISKRYGVTRTRIEMIYEKALKKLRLPRRSKRLSAHTTD